MSHWQKKKNSRGEAGDRQEANWNKGYRCPVQIHYILSPKCTLTTSTRESSITLTIHTLSEFIKTRAKQLMHPLYEIELDNSFDANSWGQRQREHEEVNQPKLEKMWAALRRNTRGSVVPVFIQWFRRVGGASLQSPPHLWTPWDTQAL